MTFEVKMNTNSKIFRVGFETNITINQIVGGDFEIYEGSYEVTPQKKSQFLPTKNTMMVENVEVKGIPFSKTPNNKGGDTISIG